MGLTLFLDDGTMISKDSTVMIKEGKEQGRFKPMTSYIVKNIICSGLGHYNVGLASQISFDSDYIFMCYSNKDLIGGMC